MALKFAHVTFGMAILIVKIGFYVKMMEVLTFHYSNMTKEELKYYIEEDQKALKEYFHPSLRPCSFFYIDKEIGKFQFLLRKCEYYFSNKRHSPLHIIKKYIYAYFFKRQSYFYSLDLIRSFIYFFISKGKQGIYLFFIDFT